MRGHSAAVETGGFPDELEPDGVRAEVGAVFGGAAVDSFGRRPLVLPRAALRPRLRRSVGMTTAVIAIGIVVFLVVILFGRNRSSGGAGGGYSGDSGSGDGGGGC
ncbi:hypothetical protein GCM10027271_20290 [Saccharopolyspora gloriosae]